MRLPVLDRRRAGVLLHLSSLEAALGRGGRVFIDWLADAGFSVWQILPAGPTGADGSPYWVRSDFAGNPAFLDRAELPKVEPAEEAAFRDEAQAWLDDYALFEVLSTVHSGAAWWTWRAGERDRAPSALNRVRRDLAAELQHIEQEQLAFFVQWRRLREHARSRGVRIVGDLPFYVAPHSAETWAHREQFQLDALGRPAAVAGVPPDYFSRTGQLWGNPLYDWQAMRRDNFVYWSARVLEQLQRVDLLRVDHFRALAAHWAVPAGAPDARGGQWRLTPGEDLLRLLMDELGDLPILAEDLGVITDDVVALRKGFGLPGMRVLQFAFSGEGDNPHLPHMHEHDSVVYTGTHDNDTTLGWYRSLDEETRGRVDSMLRAAPGSMPEALIREALGSVGQLAIIPAQDLLGLGTEARLNTPGTIDGNWRWRLPAGALTTELARHFAQLNGMYGRA
ncbi:MAG TPA: 4-alpha-glucanotransferase [Steroidobacteraceae bacterium]|nr:4-alpha-glucanotransferase [Steroidobacteraceae bacterium]